MARVEDMAVAVAVDQETPAPEGQTEILRGVMGLLEQSELFGRD